MKESCLHFNCQSLPAFISHLFTRYWTSWWMAWGWLLPVWLEYSYYWGLACSIGLVYHGLNYSSSSINKPARKKKEESKWLGGKGCLPPIPKPSCPTVVLSIRLHGDANTAKTSNPDDLWEHNLGVSKLIYVCLLFHHSRTLPFHLFMGELGEFSGNNASNAFLSAEWGTKKTKNVQSRRDAREGICHLPPH